MKIVVTGSSGFVGSALVPSLERAGHAVMRLVRRPPRPAADEVRWDPEREILDPTALRGVEAAVHLAGASLAGGRWTSGTKARIRDSRVRSTRLLSEALCRLDPPPRVLVSASAVGFYGHRGDQLLTEESPRGEGFLADVAESWERAADPARERGIRVVHPRLGLVLARNGGALARMLPAFRLGLGGPLGDGGQFWSWIAVDDLLAAFHILLDHPALAGPVNAVAPQPVTSREFAATLGRVLRRPTRFQVPAWALRLALGQMADEMLLGSTRAVPRRLEHSGFTFLHPRLEEALAGLLRRRLAA
ncbi:MAG TPA: TIGR01777 family oxidoreductase [Candidatus Eisenbacteria bacterium]|jgi:hypothetical protein